MKSQVIVIVALIAAVSCQKVKKEEEAARPADFEKMVIIQDQETGSAIGGEGAQELKMR